MDSKRSIGLHCIIAITFFTCGFAMDLRRECQRDSECDSNRFCNGEMCDKCIPCQSLLNRMPPEAGICARTEDDCGVCLDGFQSEDLTAQRRSYKCFRKVDDGSKETLEANDLYNLASILTVTISSLLLMSVIVAVIIYLVKCQPSLKKVNDESRHGREKVAVVDALPPPYNQLDIAVSDVRTLQQSFTVEEMVEDQLNQATPIYRHYYGVPDEIREDGDDLAIPHDNAPVLLEEAGTGGSTETIPSTWEPSDQDYVNESRGLIRTRSMNDPSEFSHWISGYENRIVNLSQFRHFDRPSDTGESRVSQPEDDASTEPVNSMESVLFRVGSCEDCEPEPPHSFSFLDHETGLGIEYTVNNEPRVLTRSLSATEGRSNGSSFFGFGPSRRRPAPEDFEFGFSFFLKRSRQDRS